MLGQLTPNGFAGGTINPNRFVYQSTTDNTLLQSFAGGPAVGVSTESNDLFDTDANSTTGNNVPLQASLIVNVECGGTIAAGDRVGSDANGKAVTYAGGAVLGTALQAGTSGGLIEILFIPGGGAQGVKLYSQVAAGTALTNSTTETALGSYSIPANSLAVGDVIRVTYQGIATATNSTDTLAIKVYIGGIGGTTLISAAAVDVANNDTFSGWVEIVIRTIGASGTLVASGYYKTTAAEGTATIKDDITASATIDTTAAQVIAVSGTWSVANAGNSCRLDVLNIIKF